MYPVPAMDNVTNINDDDMSLTLEEFNRRELKKFTAPLVYLFFMLFIGVPGNLSVIFIYRKRHDKSVYRTIIWNLAWIDFSFCMIAIPFNIGRLIRYYTFTELYVCKVFTTTIVLFIFQSSHLLVILSIHRFRQVCMPLRKQIEVDNIKYWIIGGLCFAAFLDIPEFILQPLDKVSLKHNITGSVCAVAFEPSLFADLYNGFLTFLFTFYTVLLLVLYIFIGRRMYIQHKLRQISRPGLSASEEISQKITKIAITVSIMFFLSYVPLWVLKSIAGEIDQQNISTTAFGVLKIFERSYIINHVVNPFIYAFYDQRFRRDFKRIFASKERLQQMEFTSEEMPSKKCASELSDSKSKSTDNSESKI